MPASLLWIPWTRFSFSGLCSEVGSTLTVLRVFTRENDSSSSGPKSLPNVHVKLSARRQFISSLLGSVEHLCAHASGYGRGFSGGLLPGDDRVCGQKEEQARDCYCAGRILRLSFSTHSFSFRAPTILHNERRLPPPATAARPPPLRKLHFGIHAGGTAAGRSRARAGPLYPENPGPPPNASRLPAPPRVKVPASNAIWPPSAEPVTCAQSSASAVA